MAEPASVAQIAAHADAAVESGIGDGARVKAVGDERWFRLALWAMRGAKLAGVGELFEVLLHRTGEWV